jgi:hypothetical protein
MMEGGKKTTTILDPARILDNYKRLPMSVSFGIAGEWPRVAILSLKLKPDVVSVPCPVKPALG